MKVLDRIMVRLRQLASIDDSQFGFVPGRGTTDAIFVEKQLHEKYLANKRLYMSFVDLEKAFDGVPQKVIRWAPRKLGVEEWIVRLVQGMNANEQSHVRVGKGYSEELKWRSVFIKTRYSACCASSLCLKPCHASSALGSPERTSLPMTLVSSLNRLRNVTWGSWLGKRAMEEKRLSKCREDIDHDLWYRPGPLQSSGEFPCAVCHTGVGSNIIFWNSCKHWVHKIAESSSAWQRTLITDVHSARELHAAWTADVQDEPMKLGMVASSCYLGDMLSAADGCEHSITTRVKTAWKKFKELLPVLFPPPLKTHGHVYSSCVQSAMLHASTTWPLTKPNSNVCSELTGQWSERSAMSSRKTLSPPEPVSYLCRYALSNWTSFCRKKGSAGMDMWNAPMVQSREPLT